MKSEKGLYFAKKQYDGARLFSFAEAKPNLPHPVIEGRPQWVSLYWYAVQVLFDHCKVPEQGSNFVSNYVDAAFNAHIFLWDTCFMTVFCNLLDHYVPGICSLDNFYANQHSDGEICREIVQRTGEDFSCWVNQYDAPLYSYFHNHYGYRSLLKLQKPPYEALYKPDLGRVVANHPILTLDALNHPLLAFAEWQHYVQTSDVNRLFQVHEALYNQYAALVYHIRHACGLYVTDWASMDNSPRNKDLFLGVDISSEMVLFSDELIQIFRVLVQAGYSVHDYENRMERLKKERDETAKQIQALMWDEGSGFFYDLDADFQQIRIKTAAAFWTLISKVATPQQQTRLVWYLNDPSTFNRLHRVPVLAADEKAYDPKGGYWRGSVWAPVNTMVVLGLEGCGYTDLAREIALNDIEITSQVYASTKTIWENYPADEASSGDSDHPEFVGWSGIAPIFFSLAYGVGLHAHLKPGVLVWNLDEGLLHSGAVGCSRFAFQGKTADFHAQLDANILTITISTEDSFFLEVCCKASLFKYEIQGSSTYIEELS